MGCTPSARSAVVSARYMSTRCTFPPASALLRTMPGTAALNVRTAAS
ncbi:hypothetical protein K7G98_08860 [Saccharothrix sp. MB29]|nr:hypothetical protein [Saccharothrix sp. MB29]